ncbi:MULTISPECIES: tectonin domain-containing protein [unclassified Streptomyces]|uniref:PLL-like beta propeller domain-containing protein n=1 Tax=Streptomyces sp. NBC_00060 TaxID=2975636 RepID=A0AAU2HAE3_9ACTN
MLIVSTGQEGGNWSPWGQFDGALRAVAAETNADGRMELFGVNSAGSIFHRWQMTPAGGSWSGWEQFDGALTSIAVARNADGRLELFGTNSAGSIFHRW